MKHIKSDKSENDSSARAFPNDGNSEAMQQEMVSEDDVDVETISNEADSPVSDMSGSENAEAAKDRNAPTALSSVIPPKLRFKVLVPIFDLFVSSSSFD